MSVIDRMHMFNNSARPFLVSSKHVKSNEIDHIPRHEVCEESDTLCPSLTIAIDGNGTCGKETGGSWFALVVQVMRLFSTYPSER